MYRALQEMNVRAADGTVATLQIGDEIPGFEGWPQWTQKAMTEAGQVRWAPEGLAPHERPANQRRVDQTVPKGPLPRPEREPKPEPAPAHATLSPGHQAMARVPAEGPAAVDSRKPEKPLARKVVPPQAGESIRKETIGRMANYDPRVQVDSDVPQKGALDCPSCERQGFKDFNGLRIHMAKAHKE